MTMFGKDKSGKKREESGFLRDLKENFDRTSGVNPSATMVKDDAEK